MSIEFRDLKSDYVRLCEQFGIPHAGESKDSLKFKLMEYAKTIPDDKVFADTEAVVAKKPRKQKEPKERTKTKVVKYEEETETDEDSVEEVPLPKSKKERVFSKRTKVRRAPTPEPDSDAESVEEVPLPSRKKTTKKTTKSTPKKNSWLEYIAEKAKEHPDMKRHELFAKFGGQAWEDYKARH